MKSCLRWQDFFCFYCYFFPALRQAQDRLKVTKNAVALISPPLGSVSPHQILQGFGSDSSRYFAKAKYIRAFPFTPRSATPHQINVLLFITTNSPILRSHKVAKQNGGERGIRTPETVARLHDFESCAFDHSAISPHF